MAVESFNKKEVIASGRGDILLIMPLDNCAFTSTDKYGIQRPYLPIVIRNPNTGDFEFSWGLIDTGANECSMPAIKSLLKQLTGIDFSEKVFSLKRKH
ncbi:MAG: hypothetical protein ABIH39_06335 [Candidatus Margulisiibacteriota bacterium]